MYAPPCAVDVGGAGRAAGGGFAIHFIIVMSRWTGLAPWEGAGAVGVEGRQAVEVLEAGSAEDVVDSILLWAVDALDLFGRARI